MAGNSAEEPVGKKEGHTGKFADAAAQQFPVALTKWPGFALAWVADLAGRRYAEALRAIGITPQHLGILTLLDEAGPMVQARLGERLAIVKPAMVGVLNQLEALGLVERRAHPIDRRAFDIHLLDAGRERLRAAEAVSAVATDTFFADLSADEREQFHRLLLRLAISNGGKSAADP